ncbi:MAG TPA: VOC family protein [Candidatus Limnocylindrales bacterium]|nr:VOC family protein [Candidatus Limnocylindrales bacterium]
MQKITPFLWFDNNAEEAVNFYVSVFKDSKIISITRYPDGPLEGPMKGFEGKVLTAVFELNGQRFMALDGGPIFKFTEATSFYVECEDQDEVDYYWDKLSAVPESEQCGWLKDKFGLSWQIIPKALGELMGDPDPEKANRVMQAMLKMKKIDIASLQQAYKG